ncbi:MAG: serine/threonine protein kinase [Bryobacterales bacterium]|nr:serine/threonine protein kinase [Bryobacterales bacterium]
MCHNRTRRVARANSTRARTGPGDPQHAPQFLPHSETRRVARANAAKARTGPDDPQDAPTLLHRRVTMAPDLWAQIEDTLGDALELPPAERLPLLQSRLAHRPEALHAAQRLLDDIPASERLFSQSPLHGWQLSAGVRFGPWQLERPLGAGGMGMVWLARRIDGQADMRAAIKILPPALAGPIETDSRLRRRFLAEKQILSQLDHPNIARLLDAGAGSGDTPNFVMEFVDGLPLHDYQLASPRERLRLFAKICHAVEYAHSKLIVHRDLKPQNILIQSSGEPKLLDFGIARLLTDQPADGALTLLRAYSLDYASPEQLRGEPIGTATDIYSLGLLLYEWITAERARNWSGFTLLQAVHAAASFELPAHPRLDSDLLAVVRKASHPDQSLRYRSATDLAADIERLIAGLPVLARPPRPAERAWRFLSRHWLAAATSGAVLALIAASTVVAVSSARQAHYQRAIALEKSRQLERSLTAERAALLSARQQSERAQAMSNLARQSRQQTEQRMGDLLTAFQSMLFHTRRRIVILPGGTKAGFQLIQQALSDIERLQPGERLRPRFLHLRAHAHAILRDLANGPNSNLGDAAGFQTHGRASVALWRELHLLEPHNFAARLNLAQAEFALVRLTLPKEYNAVWAEWERRFTQLAAMAPNDQTTLSILASLHFFAAGTAGASGFARHMDASIAHNERLLQLDPTNEVVWRDLALGHKYRSNDPSLAYPQARHHAAEALRLDRMRSAAQPENAAARLDVAYSIGARADVEARFHRNTDALSLYRESFLLRQTMLRADPGNAQLTRSLRYPLMSWGRVAAMVPDLDSVREALAAFDALPPSASPWMQDKDLGSVHLWRASLAAAAGRTDEACKHWDAALSGTLWESAADRQSLTRLRRESCPAPLE